MRAQIASFGDLLCLASSFGLADSLDCPDAEVDELYLSLSPGHFAVKAYKHFLMADNGFDFFDELLSGAFVPGAKPGY